MQDLLRHFDNAQKMEPLVLDLDGDGVELLSQAESKAFFDLDNDGFAEKTGWVGADDALLAIDHNGNGLIDDRSELFGGPGQDGFAALAAFDSNGDGRVDAADANFGRLLVWQDRNGDGVSQTVELKTLVQAGIASIGLGSTAVHQSVAGNDVTALGSFTRTDGTASTAADVWFSFNQTLTLDTRPFELNAGNVDVLFLPMLRGYGTVSNLTAAMSRDPALLQMVKDFAETPFDAATDGQVRAILYRWAGVDGMDPARRGPHGDARVADFLERFTGVPFTGWRGDGTVMSDGVAAELEKAFATVLEAAKLRLLVQAQLADVFGPGAYDYFQDRITGFNLDSAFAKALTAAGGPDGLEGVFRHWAKLLPVFDAIARDGADDYEARADAAVQQATGLALTAGDVRSIHHIAVGTAGADRFEGTGAADLFVGGGGDDYVRGGGGADVFAFGQGHGRLEVDEDNGYWNDSTAALALGAGITLAQLRATADADADGHLYLTTGTEGDRIKITKMMNVGWGGHAQWGVASLRLADGTRLDHQQVINLATTGTAGAADTLHGSSWGDTFDGKGGDDVARGRGGADTFIFRQGYGRLEVDADAGYWNNSQAVLKLGPGIAAADLRVTGDTEGNLTLATGAAGDLVKLDRMATVGWGGQAQWGVGSVQLADGAVLERQQVIRMATTGTAGDDRLYGSSWDDVFDGRSGNDYAKGRGGADTFVFGPGYGRLEVDADAGYWNDSASVLKLGPGIAAADLRVASDERGDLTLTDGAAGDLVKLVAQMNVGWGGRAQFGVASVQLADGTVLGRQQLIHLATTGGAGDDRLFGSSWADTLDGGAGDDTLSGREGPDLYRYDAGGGDDRFADDAYWDDADRLVLGAGLTSADVAVARSADGADAVLRFAGQAGSVTLVRAFWGGNWGVDIVEFADGVVWNKADLLHACVA